jgi:hypothetical protein
MKATYRVLAYLIPVLVGVQAAAIAAGTFAVLSSVDDGKPYTKTAGDNAGQAVHSFGALVIAVVALALLVVSFFAKIDGGAKWAGFVVVSVVFQFVVAAVAFSAPVVGILHGLNALVMFGLGMAAAGAATRSMRGVPAPATSPAQAL